MIPQLRKPVAHPPLAERMVGTWEVVEVDGKPAAGPHAGKLFTFGADKTFALDWSHVDPEPGAMPMSHHQVGEYAVKDGAVVVKIRQTAADGGTMTVTAKPPEAHDWSVVRFAGGGLEFRHKGKLFLVKHRPPV